MTHMDNEFSAIYRERERDRRRETDAGRHRTSAVTHRSRKRVILIAIGSVLVLAGRSIVRFGESLSKMPDPAATVLNTGRGT